MTVDINSIEHIKEEITGKLKRYFGKTVDNANKTQIYKACAITVRDMIMEKWAISKDEICSKNPKRLYYLSIEFLIGKSLKNNIININALDAFEKALYELNINFSDIEDIEADAGLGNGGLGRLAACYIDSLATLNLPAFGSSIRYEYGLFKQKIVDGYQTEMPDAWLENGNVWEIERPEEQIEVKFGGDVSSEYIDGRLIFHYNNSHTVIGIPYDVPVCGYNSKIINTLRLWSAKSPVYLDMSLFGEGDYIKATEEKQLAEVISKVLYPEDNHIEGKALRLKQQYFFVATTIGWIIKEFKAKNNNILDLPEKVAIHINDTHPALAIPELMRILLDDEGLSWDDAFSIVSKTFAYTNHTIMSEALEKWPASLFKGLLPRIYMIIYEMNERFCKDLFYNYTQDSKKISHMAIISYDQIHMANLCLSSCFAVNGVSKLHTEILKNDVFRDFYKINNNKFIAITNGITQRRWLLKANPLLTQLISSKIGIGFIKDSSQLLQLKNYADDKAFQKEFYEIKRKNKENLRSYILKNNCIDIDINSIFDVQVKRLHEYKRQLLNILHILYQYNKILENPNDNFYPKTYIFGAKASPGYDRAKLIIKLINTVANKINNDERINNKIKVVFIENYGVSVAEKIISAAEISEQISTAGKEASGTGNMKFMLNGALTIGTLDGANIEMLEQVGANNMYIFGLTSVEVSNIYKYGNKESQKIYSSNPHIKKVLDMLIDGSLEPSVPTLFMDLYNSLLFGDGFPDSYMVLRDFESYIKIHEKAVEEYKQPEIWLKKAILNVVAAGYFSSDRSILEYNENIWKLTKYD